MPILFFIFLLEINVTITQSKFAQGSSLVYNLQHMYCVRLGPVSVHGKVQRSSACTNSHARCDGGVYEPQ